MLGRTRSLPAEFPVSEAEPAEPGDVTYSLPARCGKMEGAEADGDYCNLRGPSQKKRKMGVALWVMAAAGFDGLAPEGKCCSRIADCFPSASSSRLSAYRKSFSDSSWR